MAYVSLYRKYRSQTFDDVVGQDHVVRTIRNAIKSGRIGQGYLFCGSRGTGKTTVARLIAKALNCANGPTPDPCNVCDDCRAITEGTAVDVIEMDAASNRGVDDVDALRDGVKYPPMNMRYKVYIIDEAHQLTATAKDAFLKTLEEPPPHAVFILATTEAHKIPITIRSRCQQFDFRRGTSDEISQRLRHVVAGEGASIDDDALDLLARAANGSYRDSLSILEQVMAYTEGAITAKDVYTVLGMVDEDVLLELGEVLASTDTASAFTLSDKLLREGKDVKELLKSAANHFRDILMLKVGADTRHQGDERWRDQAAMFTQDRLVRIIDVFASAEKELRWNEQHRLGLEMTMLKAMVRPREAPPVEHAAAPAHVAPQPARPAQPVQSAPPPRAPEPDPEPAYVSHSAPVETKVEEPSFAAPPAQPAAVPQPADPEPAAAFDDPGGGKVVSLADVQRDWQRILRHLQKVMKQASVAAQAREGQPVNLVDTVLTIGFSKRHGFHQDGTQKNADKVSKAILDVMGAKLRVVAVISDMVAAPAADDGGNGRDSEPVQHPLMNDLLTTFDGVIVADDKDPWEE